jgi:hypothetical protein
VGQSDSSDNHDNTEFSIIDSFLNCTHIHSIITVNNNDYHPNNGNSCDSLNVYSFIRCQLAKFNVSNLVCNSWNELNFGSNHLCPCFTMCSYLIRCNSELNNCYFKWKSISAIMDLGVIKSFLIVSDGSISCRNILDHGRSILQFWPVINILDSSYLHSSASYSNDVSTNCCNNRESLKLWTSSLQVHFTILDNLSRKLDLICLA